ncbi:MAG TPA: MFS transporter, partial [Sphingomicrobium sp.]
MANAGGFIAYVPFLTLVFPMKIEALAGASRIEWLGAATLVGALSASLGNLAFGWASDCIGSRRAWAAAGFILTPVSYVLLYLASSWSEILVAMIAYQLALNMMIAPLAAWAADVVPDRDKGLLGGLLAGGPAAGAMAGVLVTFPAVSNEAMQLTIICLMIAALAGPLIVLGAPERREPARQADPLRLRAYFDFGLLWAS